ncbi:MAG: hypothetical protein EVA53_01505 [Gammaproteobacteria bacterium]|nr:MAG: hypothetical protein EVA53_01505 [Gammaproteobacteria bacterium]
MELFFFSSFLFSFFVFLLLSFFSVEVSLSLLTTFFLLPVLKSVSYQPVPFNLKEGAVGIC